MPESPPGDATPPPGQGSADGGVGGEGADVFLSYHSRDAAAVHEVAERLEQAGVRPFLDRWNLAPGLRWRPELERALATCRAVAVFVGPDGIGDVQEREVGVALHRQDDDEAFPVIPVLLPGAEPPGGFLEGLTWIDFRHQSVAEGVAEVVRTLRGENGSGTSRERMRGRRRRYLINLVLLFLILVAGAFGYFRHLHARLAHVAVGGSVALLSLLRLAVGWVRWGAEPELRHFSQRVLSGRHSTGVLVAVLLVVGLALGVTSSVHLEAVVPPGTGPAAGYVVEVRTPAGERLWTSPALTAERLVASRGFFFRFGLPVEIHLEPAGDRTPIAARLGPASRWAIRVPDQFPRRSVNVLRLLPGSRLIQILGKPGVEVNRPGELTVREEGRVTRVPDLRKQAVYLAEEASEVSTGLDREGEDGRVARLGQWARLSLALPEDRIPAFARVWMEDPRVAAGWAPGPDLEKLEFEFILAGETTPERLTARILDATNGIRTILIERGR